MSEEPRCHAHDMDGTPVLARWAGDPSPEDIAALNEVVRAAIRVMEDEPEDVRADRAKRRGQARARLSKFL